MTFTVIAVILIVSFHFIYDGIILPSIRLHFRNELFSLRDKLRSIEINGGVTKEDEISFSIVESSVNNSIKKLHAFNFVNLNKASKIEGIQEKATERLKVISNSKNKEILNIFSQASEVTFHVFIANMGGWAIYILPIALLFRYLNKVREFIKEALLLPSSVFILRFA